MTPKRDKRQGVYIGITPQNRIYIGSVAGQRRSFSQRFREHERDIANGTHANDVLRQAGSGTRFVPIVVVKKGDVAAARRIEGILIRAIKGVCNERR